MARFCDETPFFMTVGFGEESEKATFISAEPLGDAAYEQLADRIFESLFRYLFDDPSVGVQRQLLPSNEDWSRLLAEAEREKGESLTEEQLKQLWKGAVER